MGKKLIFSVSTFYGDGVGNGMVTYPLVAVTMNMTTSWCQQSRLFSLVCYSEKNRVLRTKRYVF